MAGPGQPNIRKRVRTGNVRPSDVVDAEQIHNLSCDDNNIPEIGSTTNSPGLEENSLLPQVEPGPEKQKYGSKLASRLRICLSAHEAADATPIHANIVQENQAKKVRTAYMHENRLAREENQQNDPHSSQASATSAKRKRGQRGKYRSLALEKKTKGGLFKLDVKIPDFVLQAVGPNARPMVNFCGYVVRTTAFMDAGDWTKVFAKYGNSMWLQVKNKFNIKDSSAQSLRLEAFATDVMQRLYRYWKSRLHSYYKECGNTLEEHLENPPDDLPMESWKACCAKFNDEKFKKRSRQNSKNRLSDKWTKHTTGNLSFAEVEHIMTESNGNVLPDPDVVWLAEHTNLDGEGVLKWVNDGRSKEIHAQIHQLVKDKDKEPEGDHARPQTQEEILLQVLGPKSGYIRGKGAGYRTSAKAKLQEEQQNLLKKQQEEQQQIMEKQQDQISQLESELDASKKAMDEYKEQQRIYMEAMEKRFEDMIMRHSRLNSGCEDDEQ